MSKEQTAVGQAIQKLKDLGIYTTTLSEILDQAKEMEKKQIMDARQDGHDSTSGCDSCGYKNSLDGSNESFYKETYGE